VAGYAACTNAIEDQQVISLGDGTQPGQSLRIDITRERDALACIVDAVNHSGCVTMMSSDRPDDEAVLIENFPGYRMG
jgi:hypothetical protein